MFNFKIAYKKGADNHNGDALSRLLTATPTNVNGDDDDIPAFLLDACDDPLNISSSMVSTDPDNSSDRFTEFSERDYAPIDNILATLDNPSSDVTFTPITMEELVSAQFHDRFCSDIHRRLNEGEGLSFALDDNGLLVRTVNPDHQIVIPHSLKKRVLMLNHRPKLAAHPGGRKLYYRIKRHFYWPALSVDCYATVRNCPECARNRIKLRKNTGELTLFPANAPLESVFIDLLGELTRTPRGNRYLLIITDRFTKLVRTVPLKGISAAAVTQAFVTHWVFFTVHRPI